MTNRRRPGRPPTARPIPTKSGFSARVWIEEDGIKRRVQVDLGTRSRPLAKAKGKRLLETGEMPTEGQSFREAAEYVFGQRDFATKAQQWAKLERFAFPLFGDKPVEQVTVVDVHNAMHACEEAVGGFTQSVRHTKNAISQVLGPLAELDLIGENVALRIKFRRKDGTLGGRRIEKVELPPAVLTDAEFEALISHGLEEGEGTLPELYLMCLVARVFGGRISDVYAWRWEHIDLERWVDAFVPRPKTKKDEDESAPHELPEAFVPHLVSWWERRGRPTEGAVFPVRRGRRVGEHRGASTGQVKALRRALWEAGVHRPLPGYHRAKGDDQKRLCALQSGDGKRQGPVDFHSFRRAAATAAATSGVSLQQQMAVLDHSDARTTMGYVRRHQAVEVPAAMLPAIPAPSAQSRPVKTSARAILPSTVAENRSAKHTKQRKTGRARKDSNLRPMAPEASGSAHTSVSLDKTRGLDAANEPITPHATAERQNPLPELDPLEMVRKAAAEAVAQGDFALFDKLRPALESSRPAPLPDNVRPLDAARKGKS